MLLFFFVLSFLLRARGDGVVLRVEHHMRMLVLLGAWLVRFFFFVFLFCCFFFLLLFGSLHLIGFSSRTDDIAVFFQWFSYSEEHVPL